MKYFLTVTIFVVGIASIANQKPAFTFWGTTSESKKLFAWTGERLQYLNPTNDETKLLLSLEGFSDANSIMICDRNCRDALVQGLYNHQNVQTLVIISDHVSELSVSNIMKSCKKLKKLSLDCPNVDVRGIDFSSLKHLSIVYRGDGFAPFVQKNLPKGDSVLEIIRVGTKVSNDTEE